MMRHQCRLGMTGRLGVIKITLGIDLQPHGKLMEMLRHLVIVIKALVKIGLAITIAVMQNNQLIPAGHIDFSVDDFQSQRLKQPTGNASPGKPLAHIIGSPDPPDITIPRAGQDLIRPRHVIKTSQSDPGQPWIGSGPRQHVDGKRSLPLANNRLGLENLVPAWRASLGQGQQVFIRLFDFQPSSQFFGRCLRLNLSQPERES